MKSIVLIGMMGAGKTTALQMLTKGSNLTGIDTDDVVETVSGMSIPEIFEVHNEKYFRNLESGALLKTLGKYDIIASGGGIIKREQNRKLLANHASVIYLKASLSTLKKRLQNSERPLLPQLESVFNERKFIYESCANFTINTDDLTPEEVVTKVKKFTDAHLNDG